MGNFCGCNYQNQNDNKENVQNESALTSVYNIKLKYIIYLLFLIKVIV